MSMYRVASYLIEKLKNSSYKPTHKKKSKKRSN